MDRDAVNFFEEEAKASSPVSVQEVVNLAQQAVERERVIKDLEEALAAQKSALNELKTKLLPDAMAQIGQAEFVLEDGTKVGVENFVHGSLPKDPVKRAAALEYLTAEGGESLIKNEVSLTFGRSQHNEALALAARLREQGYEVEVASNVHASTLTAWVREKLRSGEQIEAEKVGCFVGRMAKIKLPKEK